MAGRKGMRTQLRLMRSVALAPVMVIAMGMLSVGSRASAATVMCDAATNHCYEAVAVAAGITWPDAKAASEARSYNGFPGHLVTITSQAETNFLVTSGLALSIYWIGGSQ